MWLRFVDGRPLGAVTTQFLDRCCTWLAALGRWVLVLMWDNANWHVSADVRAWVRTHNQAVKARGTGVRVLVCALPTKSLWLNPIQPTWTDGKPRIAEPTCLLSLTKREDRVYAASESDRQEHLTTPELVA